MSECEEEREDDEPSLSVIVSLVDLLVSGVGVGSAAQFVLFTPVLGMGREEDIYIGVTQYPCRSRPSISVAQRPKDRYRVVRQLGSNFHYFLALHMKDFSQV